MLFYMIKYILYSIKSKLGVIYTQSKYKKDNPTCKFDYKAFISNCIFEKYVTIIGNSVLFATNVGAFSYIQTNGRIFNCSIGRFCSIAAGVTIAPGIHDLTCVSTHPVFYSKTSILPKRFVNEDKLPVYERVEIGHDVWIGEKVIVIDGVKIGNGAVIAAGAVVIKDVEPYSVVGGVPAKHIKYRFDKETIETIQKSEWWKFSEIWLEQNANIMLDAKKFVEVIEHETNN